MTRSWPACVGLEEVAQILGWPAYYLPFLVGAGHLKPLGKPNCLLPDCWELLEQFVFHGDNRG
jgi:hypothetical protein